MKAQKKEKRFCMEDEQIVKMYLHRDDK